VAYHFTAAGVPEPAGVLVLVGVGAVVAVQRRKRV